MFIILLQGWKNPRADYIFRKLLTKSRQFSNPLTRVQLRSGRTNCGRLNRLCPWEFQHLGSLEATRWQLAKNSTFLRFSEMDSSCNVWFQLQKKKVVHSQNPCPWNSTELAGVDRISEIGGATNTRTFSSTRRYFALPPMTCLPGAPVRWPPGRNAWRVPMLLVSFTTEAGQSRSYPCSSPCYPS